MIPEPTDTERAAAAKIAGECLLAGPNLGRGMRRCPELNPILLERWCFACRFGAEVAQALAKARAVERSRCAQWARWWAMSHDYHAEYRLASRRRPETKKARRDRGRDMAYKASLCVLGSIEEGEDAETPRHIKDGPLLRQFFAAVEQLPCE